MDKNHKRSTSRQSNVPYSPNKDLVDGCNLSVEKKTKKAEVEKRAQIYEASTTIRHGQLSGFEDHERAEALKRREEIDVIMKQLAEIEKRVNENMKK